jgi:hypothetical protein
MKDTIKKEKQAIPQIVLIDGDTEYPGVMGSYCWDGICVDYAKPSDRQDFSEKIFIKKDASITFKVFGDINPDQLHLTIFAGDRIMSHQTINTHMKMSVPKGEYFLNLKATWKGKGDVSNVFLVEIQ